MAIYKLTWFFEGPNASGWTESWYKTGDNGQQVIDATDAGNPHMDTVRRQLLANNCYLKYLRACNIDSPRDAQLYSYAGNSGVGTAAGIADEEAASCENVRDAVNIRVFVGESKWKSWMLRGLPRGAIRADGTLNGGLEWYGKMALFVERLVTGTWGLRVRTTGDSRPVISLDRANNRISAISTVGLLPGVAVGGYVSVNNIIGISNANGLYKVTSVAVAGGNQLIGVRLRQRFSYGDNPPAFGTAAAITYGLGVITSGKPVRLTTRKAGRPSFLPAGRARVRRS